MLYCSCMLYCGMLYCGCGSMLYSDAGSMLCSAAIQCALPVLPCRSEHHGGDRAQLYFTRLEAADEATCRAVCAQKAICAGYLWTVVGRSTIDHACMRDTRTHVEPSCRHAAFCSHFPCCLQPSGLDWSGSNEVPFVVLCAAHLASARCKTIVWSI